MSQDIGELRLDVVEAAWRAFYRKIQKLGMPSLTSPNLRRLYDMLHDGFLQGYVVGFTARDRVGRAKKPRMRERND
jgi:hypothetical protein